MIDPLLARLFERLPPVGSEWPLVERVRWLRAFAASLELVYDRNSDADINVTLLAAAALEQAAGDEVEEQVRRRAAP